jgi:hypothetical protein
MIGEDWLIVLEADIVPHSIVAFADVLEIAFDTTDLTLDFHSVSLLKEDPPRVN